MWEAEEGQITSPKGAPLQFNCTETNPASNIKSAMASSSIVPGRSLKAPAQYVGQELDSVTYGRCDQIVGLYLELYSQRVDTRSVHSLHDRT